MSLLDLVNTIGQVLIVNCDFSGAHNQKNLKVTLSTYYYYGTGSTVAIVRFTI